MKRLFLTIISFAILICFTGCAHNHSHGEHIDTTSTVSTHAENHEHSGNDTAKKPDKEMSEEQLAKVVAKSLNVPDKDTISYKVSEKFYWEAAQTYCRNVGFFENGELVAHACVDVRDGELMRNINKYAN